MGLKVLIVEDNLNDQLTIGAILKKEGHVVSSCDTGEEALERLETLRPDLVLLDLQLEGGLSGFEILQRLRARKDFINCKIIIVSGRRQKKDVVRAMKMGANDYIVKPIDPEILNAKLGQTLFQQSDWFEYRLEDQSPFAAAKIEIPLTVVSVNEIGMVLRSPLTFGRGQNLQIFSELLNEVKIPSSFLKVMESKIAQEPDPETGEKMYDIHVSFFGLSPDDLQSLRVFCRKLNFNSKEKTA